MAHADNLLKRQRGHEELANVVGTVRDLSATAPPTARTIETIGEGWTGEEALGIALFCALGANTGLPQDIMDALWLSVAHSGDSDSTGSMTGNLLGALVGVERLPELWLQGLELGDVVDRVACDLYAATMLGSKLDDESYPPY